ncbi:MAG TPA: hypothetical protein VGD74_08960 [Vulgatibacter sp.]
MYNILAKHRVKAPFTAAERSLHLKIGTDELMRLHDELDRAVLDAYGWPHDIDDDELLARLVDLNAERAEEEKSGYVRWLRPPADARPQQADWVGKAASGDGGAERKGPAPWPADALDQLADVLALMRASNQALDTEAVASHFARAPRRRVADLLERLADRRLLVADDGGRYRSTA